MWGPISDSSSLGLRPGLAATRATEQTCSYGRPATTASWGSAPRRPGLCGSGVHVGGKNKYQLRLTVPPPPCSPVPCDTRRINNKTFAHPILSDWNCVHITRIMRLITI